MSPRQKERITQEPRQPAIIWIEAVRLPMMLAHTHTVLSKAMHQLTPTQVTYGHTPLQLHLSAAGLITAGKEGLRVHVKIAANAIMGRIERCHL